MSRLTDYLTDIADAIREKKGTSGLINASDFASEILNLPSGGGSNVDYSKYELKGVYYEANGQNYKQDFEVIFCDSNVFNEPLNSNVWKIGVDGKLIFNHNNIDYVISDENDILIIDPINQLFAQIFDFNMDDDGEIWVVGLRLSDAQSNGIKDIYVGLNINTGIYDNQITVNNYQQGQEFSGACLYLDEVPANHNYNSKFAIVYEEINASNIEYAPVRIGGWGDQVELPLNANFCMKLNNYFVFYLYNQNGLVTAITSYGYTVVYDKEKQIVKIYRTYGTNRRYEKSILDATYENITSVTYKGTSNSYSGSAEGYVDSSYVQS